MGWDGSPLKPLSEDGRVRTIPIPTRRATLKETQRVYEELSSVVISPVSLLSSASQPPLSKPKPVSSAPKPKKDTTSKPKEKGKDHLKKRDEKPKTVASTLTDDEVDASPPPPTPLDDALVRLAKICLDFDEAALTDVLQAPAMAGTTLSPEYFADDVRFAKIDEPIGLVGVAAVAGRPDVVEWLMDHSVDPAVGTSPYLATKNKGVRTALRKYWAAHPDKFDYEAAGVPSPLTNEDLDAMAERDRAKRKKDKLKKKDKSQAKKEASKTPEERARETRAAAAEARLLGNRCAACKKSLVGKVPFERMDFKYCSVNCVEKHRKELNQMTRR